MKKIATPLVLGLALAFLAAGCSPKAQNETSEAASAISADANATMSAAARDTEDATDKALGAAEAKMDNAATALGNASDKARDKTGQALKDAGNAIEE